jgi:ElaB/YqjD/DUF883 family membrane-anchored ribosome-binding protein
METREETGMKSGNRTPRPFETTPTLGRDPVENAARAAEETADDLKARVTETVSRAKEKVAEAYDRTSDVASRAYRQAMDYSRENPGKATLVALGAGFGAGVLFAQGMPRSRGYRRMLPTVAMAVADAVLDVFDYRR